MTFKTVASISILLLACNLVYAENPAVMRASCKVGYGGRGFVYKEDTQNYYILTAGHVITDSNDLSVKFFHAGESHSMPTFPKIALNDTRPIGQILFDPDKQQGEIISNDIGILVLPKVNVGNYPPPIPIPLADDDYEIQIKQKYSVAVRKNNRLTTHEGKIMWVNKYYFRVDFVGAKGWSGSGFTNEDGTKLIGIINKGYGPKGDDPIIIHHKAIRNVLGKAL